ncbi:hypothetical protein [Propionivibrio sp.]|uniref:hypothetical protein n=1 Tax=Propionivibrio sp. TaxID=2212460 RepID=UPI003BF1C11B
MLTWTPDPAAPPWAEVQEDEKWAEPAITAVDDSDTALSVTNYSYEVVGDPIVGLVVVSGAGGVTVSAPKSLVGSFPAIDIEYQIKGATGHCLKFSDIPIDADEVIKFQPCASSVKRWTIRVTAELSDQTTDSAEFLITVHANFTPGCTALKEAVNALRH